MLQRIRPHLHTGAMTVNGRTLGENIEGAEVFDDDVIRPLDNPIYAEGALAVLRGNLAPDGVVIKPSACAPHLLQHSGRALVFDDYPALKKAVDDPELEVTADDILVLRNAGPLGAGMPEWGMLPIPTKLLKAGVTDMLRLSDARMSGTSYGGCLLHCAPEAAVGGPLALLRTGDRITVDVPARRIHLEVERRGTGRAPRRLAAAAAALRARLRLALRPACAAGRPGLRFRLPRNRLRRGGGRAGHLLTRKDSAMQAMQLRRIGGPLEWTELPERQPGPGEIRVRVAACGVCRTDLHVLDGDLPDIPLPIIPGHEVVGRIDALGAGVEGLRLGERVGLPWLGHTCGAVPVLRGPAGEPVRPAAVHRLHP